MKRKENIAFAIGLLVAGTTLYACHDDETIIEQKSLSESVVENEKNPTEDQLAVKYRGRSVVFGSDRTDFNASVVNRMVNASSTVSSDAKAYVFTSGFNTAGLSVDDASSLLKAYIEGAVVVFISPEKTISETFVSTIGKAIEKLGEEGYDTTKDEVFLTKMNSFKSRTEAQFEAVAFRSNSVYTMPSLKEMAKASGENTTGFITDEDGNVTSKTCTAENYQPTAYDYGLVADGLVRWIDESSSNDDGSNSSEIDELMNFTTTYVNNVLGPSRALQKTMNYSLAYHVYSAYDFDNDRDYYFVRLNPTFHCSELDCVTNTDSGWKPANREVIFDNGSTSGTTLSRYTDLWYGPYMSKFYLSASVQSTGASGEKITVENALPKTEISGSSSFSTGFSWSLGGNVGFSAKGPSGGASSGIVLSESHSHSEKDLKVVHSDYGANATEWTYTGISPQCHSSWNPFKSIFHDEVGQFQKTDWQTELTWIFVVDHPKKDHEYQMETKEITEIKELNYNMYDYELAVHPENKKYITLDMPNRFKETYTLSCSDTDLRAYLSSQLKNVWKDEFTYYGHTENEVSEGAKDWFCGSKVSSIMKSVQALNIHTSKGFVGTYTFRLRKKGSADDVATFTIENGEIKEINKDIK